MPRAAPGVLTGTRQRPRRRIRVLEGERLSLHEIANDLDLVEHARDYRVQYNTIRQHQTLSGNSPEEVQLDRKPLDTQLTRSQNPANCVIQDPACAGDDPSKPEVARESPGSRYSGAVSSRCGGE